MNANELFDIISEQLKNEEANSTILRNQIATGKKWNYSICATPIVIGKPLVLGINWGGGGPKDNFDYSVQNKMPTKEGFLKELKNGEYKFLSLSKKYFEKHLDLNIDTDDFNYSNLCFFRTPNIKYLKGEDFKISIPILKQYVKELKPSFILSLGNTNINYLKQSYELNNNSLELLNSGKALAYKGTLWSIPFCCLPHPGAHLFGNDRDKIWDLVFKKM